MKEAENLRVLRFLFLQSFQRFEAHAEPSFLD